MARLEKLNMETRHMSSRGETELTVGEDIVTSWRQGRQGQGQDKDKLVGSSQERLSGTGGAVVEPPIVPRLFVLPSKWHPSVCGSLVIRGAIHKRWGDKDEPRSHGVLRCLGQSKVHSKKPIVDVAWAYVSWSHNCGQWGKCQAVCHIVGCPS